MMQTSTTVTSAVDNTCKACKGKGVQKRNDGIKVVCPSCHGTGIYVVPAEYKPYKPQEWFPYTVEPLDTEQTTWKLAPDPCAGCPNKGKGVCVCSIPSLKNPVTCYYVQ